MRVVYLSYTGLLEPLGRSQVFNYLRILSHKHQITLISFEKGKDLDDTAAFEAARQACAAHGIRWLPQRYHHRPRLLATAWDLVVFTLTAMREVVSGKAGLIHARGYLATFVALFVGKLTGRPFIFDMRAFWPEEMVAAGRLKRGGALYRLIKAAERVCLRQAVAVVSLSQAAVTYMQASDPGLADVDFTVIPTCADLELFRPTGAAPPRDPPVIGSVGSILSGWFLLDWLMAFYGAVLEAWPDARFPVVSRDDPNAILGAARAAGLPADRFSIAPKPSDEVPAAVSGFTAAAMFFSPGIAKLASCPTRMGEILGCGLPVVANAGVGDVGEIITRYRVGVLVEENTPAAMRRAVADLKTLMEDPGLAARCRAAAEDWFSLAGGAASYDAIYEKVSRSL